jgi:LmbE family N-acetylglucosaminyl deacetylase
VAKKVIRATSVPKIVALTVSNRWKKDMRLRLLQYPRILALSPHLDDAALSIGGTIAEAVKAGADVRVGTIFTADAPPAEFTSPIIAELNALWKLGPSPMVFRRSEDAAAMQVLGAGYVHGDLPDAIYRTDRNGDSVYPTRGSVFSAPSPQDKVAIALNLLFTKWLEEIEPDVILCPLAVGRHVDHVITSETFRNIALDRHLDVFLYEDLPYSTGRFPPELPDSVENALERTSWVVSHSEEISVDFSHKIASVKQYQSQLGGLFSDESGMEKTLSRYMSRDAPDGILYERMWAAPT